ncbi:hypothetical protein BKI52_03660 [marine bacterium AO1-C]|nr:hypothetical protein BKI52_03660 [marine bacterium AO1-C]
MTKNKVDGLIQTLFTDQKLYKALLAKAFQMLGNDAESEDVVNEAYIKLFEVLNQAQEVSNPSGFLWNTVYRKAIDILRKKQSNQQYTSHCLATQKEARACQEMKRFEQGEEWRHWLKKVQLNEAEQTLFGYIKQEYTNQEIAKVLDVSADEIRKRRFSLKRKFQRLLKSA